MTGNAGRWLSVIPSSTSMVQGAIVARAMSLRRFALVPIIGAVTVPAGLAAGAFGQSPSGSGAPVTISFPTAGSTFHGTSVGVTGTVGPDANGEPTAVQVNGESAPVSNGEWSLVMPVSPGEQTITVTATDPAGVQSTASLTFFDNHESPHPGGNPSKPVTLPTATQPGSSSESAPSTRRSLCTVPKISPDTKMQRAAHKVTAAGCPIGGYRWKHSTKVPKGDLIQLRPTPGHRLPVGQKVVLLGSSGPARSSVAPNTAEANPRTHNT